MISSSNSTNKAGLSNKQQKYEQAVSIYILWLTIGNRSLVGLPVVVSIGIAVYALWSLVKMSFLTADKEQLRKSGIAQGKEFSDESVASAEVEGAIAQSDSNTQVSDLIMLHAS